MPFYRFENFKSYRFNPHLSTADGPVIEGEYLYFRMVTKKAGTGAELHYHPNELLAFPLRGKVDCIVGTDPWRDTFALWLLARRPGALARPRGRS